MKDNPCVKFAYIDKDGQPVYKNKLCFDTDVEADATKDELYQALGISTENI